MNLSAEQEGERLVPSYSSRTVELLATPAGAPAGILIGSGGEWVPAAGPLALWYVALCSALAACVVLLTVGGNLIVILSFVLERSIRQPTNYFIASLAVSDLLIGAVSMPLYTVYLLSGKHWLLGEVLCDLWLSVDYTACLCSIYTVFCITADRFCSVRFPAKYRRWRTEGKVVLIVALTWLVPMSVFFPSIFGWQYFAGRRTVPAGMCYVQYMEDALFNCLLQVGYFWITLAAMFVLYVGIYRVARDLHRRSAAQKKKTLSALVSMAGRTVTQIGSVISMTSRRPHALDYTLPPLSAGDEDGDMAQQQEAIQQQGAAQRGRLTSYVAECSPHSMDGRVPLLPFWYETENRFASKRLAFSDISGSTCTSEAKTAKSHSTRVGTEELETTENKQIRCVLSHDARSQFPLFSRTSYKQPVAFELSAICSSDLPEVPCGGGCGKRVGGSLNACARTDVTSTAFAVHAAPELLRHLLYADDEDTEPLEAHHHASKPHHASLVPHWPLSYLLTLEECQSVEYAHKHKQRTAQSRTNVHWAITKSSSVPVDLKAGDSSAVIRDFSDRDMTMTNHSDRSRTSLIIGQNSINKLPSMNCICKLSENSHKCMRNVNLTSFARDWLRKSLHLKGNKSSNIPTISVDSLKDERTVQQRSSIFRERSVDKKIDDPLTQGKQSPPHQRPPVLASSSSSIMPTSLLQSAQPGSLPPESVPLLPAPQSPPRTAPLWPTRTLSLGASDKQSASGGPARLQMTKYLFRQTSGGGDGEEGGVRGRSLTQQLLQSDQRTRKALRTITLILGAFVLCWIPWHVLSLIIGFCPPAAHTERAPAAACVEPVLYDISYWLCYLNSPLNPFCYALANQQFKKTFTRILRRDWRRN